MKMLAFQNFTAAVPRLYSEAISAAQMWAARSQYSPTSNCLTTSVWNASSSAVAHIAAKNDVPFVILRAMSDNAD